jgi:hypothetical protein
MLKKQLFATPRGRIVIDRGFIMNKHAERYLHLYLPYFLYNSDRFRNLLKLFSDVVYPIFVVMFPLIHQTIESMGPVWAHLKLLFEKDVVLRGLVWAYLYMWGVVFYFAYPLKALVVDYLKYDWSYLTETLLRLNKAYSPEIGFLAKWKSWMEHETTTVIVKADLIMARFKKLIKSGRTAIDLFEKYVMIGPVGSLYRKGKQMADSANKMLQINAF